MKQAMKGLFSILLLVSTAVQATNTVGRSFFLGGLGNGASNGLIQHAGRTNLFDAEGFYAVFSSHSEYSQNFDRDSIAEYLFFNGTATMTIGPRAIAAIGTSTANSAKTDIHSQQLLLGESFDARITAAPKVKTFSGNLDLYIGLGDLWEGLYLDMNLPIVHTKWDMGLTETAVTADTTILTDVLDDAGAVTAPYTSVITALKGDKTVGDVTSVMSYHKVDGEQSKTKVGNAKAVLGYNVINKENCHFGLGLLGVFNGNGATKADYAFEPNVGTAGRHGLGGRVDGHMNLYEKDEHNLSAHMRADVFTTFKRTMRRTYDFTANGVGSRYNLIKEYSSIAVYSGTLHQGVNITSLEAKIGMNVVYEADFMLHYTNGNFIVDAGYGLRGHSKEEHKSWVGTIAGSKYGFWGVLDSGAGFTPINNGGATDNETATDALVNGFNTAANSVTVTAANSITEALLNKDSALAPAAMSHQVYGNLGYTWADSEWNPMIAVGGGASFSGDDNNAFDLWTVHLSMGASF